MCRPSPHIQTLRSELGSGVCENAKGGFPQTQRNGSIAAVNRIKVHCLKLLSKHKIIDVLRRKAQTSA